MCIRDRLLCYDGSGEATDAIERAAALFAGRRALVVTVWQARSPVGSLASVTGAKVDTFAATVQRAAERARRVTLEGVRIASEAGLMAEPATVRTHGPVWTAILEIAD